MCGIYVSDVYNENIIHLINNRGCDYQQILKFNNLFLGSSVLAIRGFYKQPVVENGFAFLYNGEIYMKAQVNSDRMLNREIEDECLSNNFDKENILSGSTTSDTLFIKDTIESVLASLNIKQSNDLIGLQDPETFVKLLFEQINKFENEMALVLIFKNVVLFFKDDIGKKSLGLNKSHFCLSSIYYDEEINSCYLYIYHINEKTYTKLKKRNFLIPYYNFVSDMLVEYLRNDLCVDKTILDRFYKTNLNIQNNLVNLPNLDKLLRNSVKRRLCESLIVFFSGGIDSLLISVYLHLVSDISLPIYLINTGFIKSQDRITGQKAYIELEKVYCSRKWIFIENDLDIKLIKKKLTHIKELVYPKHGKMDINIGIVLYFTALRARQFGKVAFLGSGADEIFGGYSKYKKEFTKHKMVFDILTISYHNLMRDDRIISDCNLECRLPFLDTGVLDYSIKIQETELFDKQHNKLVLRQLLRKYGLREAAEFSKKAIQYGTGLSKQEKSIYD